MRGVSNKSNIPLANDESSTLTTPFLNSQSSIEPEKEIYISIMNINNRLDNLEKENKMLREELSDTRNRENKLLNRFSWLIQIVNIGSTIFIVMSIILFIDSFYPFIKKITSDSIGATIVIGIIGTAISGGIIAMWCKFNKYVQEVIKREKE